MFDINQSVFDESQTGEGLSDLRSFIDDHADALYDAAALLAGGRGVRIVDRIIDGLTSADEPTRRTVDALLDLRDILSLEGVEDFSRPEAHCFVAVDPSEPVVEEVCLLTDTYSEVLENAGLDHPHASLRSPLQVAGQDCARPAIPSHRMVSCEWAI